MEKSLTGGNTTVHIVAENNKGTKLNTVLGFFGRHEEAEQAVRNKGEILWWKEDYFKFFTRVWSMVKTEREEGGSPIRSCFWIDRRQIDLGADSESFETVLSRPRESTYVVCEKNRYTMSTSIIGFFRTLEEAEKIVRNQGEVLDWKENYYLPFGRVFAQVRTKRHGALLRSWCWIEEWN
jgi:hypothetical protein